jgi:hypothetical protein
MPQTLVDMLQDIVGERPHAVRLLRRPREIDAFAFRLDLDQMVAVALAERDPRPRMALPAREVEEQLLEELDARCPARASRPRASGFGVSVAVVKSARAVCD